MNYAFSFYLPASWGGLSIFFKSPLKQLAGNNLLTCLYVICVLEAAL